MDEKPKAFAIMPFNPEFNSIYENLIKQPLEEIGYHVARADSFLDQRNILSDIIRGVTTADLIVADLTTNSPNVFYELGLCHALGRPTVLIAQSIDDVPFDLRSYKIHIYETHFDKIQKLKDALKEIGEKHKRGEISFGNPVIDFSPNKEQAITKNSETVSEDAASEIDGQSEERGLLDYLSDADKASNRLTSILKKILKDNEAVTNKITKHTTSMRALSSNPMPGSAGKFHKIALLVASDINTFSRRVEDTLPMFAKTIDELNENYSGYINIIKPKTDEDKEQLDKLRATISSLLQGAGEANTSMSSYRDSVIGLTELKMSKDLTRATRRQAQALSGIISNIERVEAFCVKTLTMIDEKFELGQ